jgi:hypothetical protein
LGPAGRWRPRGRSLRRLISGAGNSREVLTPFGIADALESGTHTIALVREAVTGGPPSNFFTDQDIAAIALGT